MKVKWKPIHTAPKDRDFLAWTKLVSDKYDEDILIEKNVITYKQVVAYYFLGQILTYPYTGSICKTITYLAWTDLPDEPTEFK